MAVGGGRGEKGGGLWSGQQGQTVCLETKPTCLRENSEPSRKKQKLLAMATATR